MDLGPNAPPPLANSAAVLWETPFHQDGPTSRSGLASPLRSAMTVMLALSP